MAKILVIGGGGREHAVCIKLAQSSKVDAIFVTPGNAGTATEHKCSNIDLDWKNFAGVADWCQKHSIDLVFVGPEEPLAMGIADFLLEKSIPVFGAKAQAAEIEASKSFAKDFMLRHSIPTARYASFKNVTDAVNFIQQAPFQAHVVKASGLASGKGVIVANNNEEAIAAVKSMLEENVFGSAGNEIVIEEKLEGPEISCLAFTDGERIACMPPAQDHKRLRDGDQGPNTGGMGAYCPYPLVSQEDLHFIQKEVLQKAVDGLREEKRNFQGVLYAGMMLTKEGPRVIEFNCRFGDPETTVILPLLSSDLYEIALHCALGSLNPSTVHFDTAKSALCIVTVSKGYPGSFEKGKQIHGLQAFTSPAREADASTYIVHAGTALHSAGHVVSNGGRVLNVVGVSSKLADAQLQAQESCLKVCFDGLEYRRDIGAQAIQAVASRRPVGLTYASAGVSIDAGDELVRLIKPAAKATERVGCASTLGLFGALFDLKAAGYKDPLLVSGTDGVGTKLKVAITTKNHHTVGQDLVAMCVNDTLCHGAEPLFFLDYFACSKLHPHEAAEVIIGIADGCKLAGCALVGGETAEMPGMYAPDDYDLAGFAVGAVEKDALLPRMDDIASGDVLIYIASSGAHSNGYSLIRKIVEKTGVKFTDPAPFDATQTLGDVLLKPTRIYCKSVLKVLRSQHGSNVKGLVHITGGGLIENIPRILRPELGVELDATKWTIPPLFTWLAQEGGLDHRELCRTFNVGIGMLLVVAPTAAAEVVALLHANGDADSGIVGTVLPRSDSSKDQVVVRNLPAIGAPKLNKSLTAQKRVRVGVLISGSGTNLQALLDHCQDNADSVCEIGVVISNIPDVQGLERARKYNVPTEVIPHRNLSREEFEKTLDAALVRHNCEIVCLAGFMRILSPYLVQRWRGRLLNVHPSLLPSFKGAHAHRLVLQSGVRITGATVHFVIEDVDAGAIISQASCPVHPDDTESTLAERVKTSVEHRIYPEAMELVASGKCTLHEDNRVVWHHAN